ncbi:unnamed protein product [Leptidea sinapis]|uniref:Uncharacterized protein n=1 Tax=Leptidea sinapis TaxID=189913 RepID=A0A5E4PT30_9NEOP|nr:unnamed protein product [Leptidea sinapis]
MTAFTSLYQECSVVPTYINKGTLCCKLLLHKLISYCGYKLCSLFVIVNFFWEIFRYLINKFIGTGKLICNNC